DYHDIDDILFKFSLNLPDACISWEMTDALLREIHKDLSGQLAVRVA
ncbi:hypothetical protein MJI95_34435, partial [Salmonella enterica subsp. enterica serovar Kentucky]|nr:hypothetical protein [Salmonella enterica subsp. enterica serovar Kentucky]